MKKIAYMLTIVAALAMMPATGWAQHQQRPPVEKHHRGNHQSAPHDMPPAPRPDMRPELPPCATPEQMGMVMQTLRAQVSDDKKLEIANLCVTIGYFCTEDMARMASLFSFDDKRLDFLRYAYAYCTDKEHYPFLKDCFTFSSNYDELMRYIYPSMSR